MRPNKSALTGTMSCPEPYALAQLVLRLAAIATAAFGLAIFVPPSQKSYEYLHLSPDNPPPPKEHGQGLPIAVVGFATLVQTPSQHPLIHVPCSCP